MIKITMTLELPYDNEIQFFDACKGASKKLDQLAQRALDSGDIEDLTGEHDVVSENDEREPIGVIEVTP